jgi:hypothetical protein
VNKNLCAANTGGSKRRIPTELVGFSHPLETQNSTQIREFSRNLSRRVTGTGNGIEEMVLQNKIPISTFKDFSIKTSLPTIGNPTPQKSSNAIE